MVNCYLSYIFDFQFTKTIYCLNKKKKKKWKLDKMVIVIANKLLTIDLWTYML